MSCHSRLVIEVRSFPVASVFPPHTTALFLSGNNVYAYARCCENNQCVLFYSFKFRLMSDWCLTSNSCSSDVVQNSSSYVSFYLHKQVTINLPKFVVVLIKVITQGPSLRDYFIVHLPFSHWSWLCSEVFLVVWKRPLVILITSCISSGLSFSYNC